MKNNKKNERMKDDNDLIYTERLMLSFYSGDNLNTMSKKLNLGKKEILEKLIDRTNKQAAKIMEMYNEYIENKKSKYPENEKNELSKYDFSNSQKYWDFNEEKELGKLYILDEVNLLDISIQLKRSPFIVIKKMVEKKMVENKNEIRGYEEFRKSRLYYNLLDYFEQTNMEKNKE